MDNISYRLLEDSGHLEYRMTIKTRGKRNAENLAKALLALDAVTAFSIDYTDK